MRDEGVYLENILECIGRVQLYVAEQRECFFTDQMTQDAVMRNLHILAESCGRLPSELRERRSDINWRGIAGFRNVIVHDYLNLDLEKIWEVIETDLPPLAIVIAEELARVDAALQDQGQEGST